MSTTNRIIISTGVGLMVIGLLVAILDQVWLAPIVGFLVALGVDQALRSLAKPQPVALLIMLAAVLAIESFFLPWWRSSRTSVSGWERSIGSNEENQIIFGSGGQIVDYDRPSAPILLGVLFADIGCLILTYLASKGQVANSKGIVLTVGLGAISLLLLFAILLSDYQSPRVVSTELPFLWNAHVGIYLTSLSNVGVITGSLYDFWKRRTASPMQNA